MSTQIDQWYETDTDKMLDVTSPHNILVSGRLTNGAVVSAHVASNPFAGSGYTMEIYGRKGTLVATSEDSPQLGAVYLQGAQGTDDLQDIDIPDKHTNVLEGMPDGPPKNVGQMYYQFGEAIQGNAADFPTFDTAVDLHRLIDSIRLSSDEGRKVDTIT